MIITKLALALFGLLYLVLLGISALLYQHTGIGADWWSADRSSIGRLSSARHNLAALGGVATAVVGWGGPIRVNRFVPVGRRFVRHRELALAADGETAAVMIPRSLALGNVNSS